MPMAFLFVERQTGKRFLGVTHTFNSID